MIRVEKNRPKDMDYRGFNAEIYLHEIDFKYLLLCLDDENEFRGNIL